MVYTLTLNPCLDYYISTPNALVLGKTNRAQSARLCAGGKGINVSLALKKLGVESTALVVLSGKNGDRIRAELEENGLPCKVFEACGESRINVKINSACIETEINSQGPPIDKNVLDEIMQFCQQIKGDDALILAGSLPKECPESVYADIAKAAKCSFVAIDCAGSVLCRSLAEKPFVIKPNIDELSDIVGREISWNEVPRYAKKLNEMGARYVLVSVGEKGAVLCSENGYWKSRAPEGELVCATGAGDTMLAAFVCAMQNQRDEGEALRFAVAAGSAKAFCSGFPEIHKIESLKSEIEVEKGYWQ